MQDLLGGSVGTPTTYHVMARQCAKYIEGLGKCTREEKAAKALKSLQIFAAFAHDAEDRVFKTVDNVTDPTTYQFMLENIASAMADADSTGLRIPKYQKIYSWLCRKEQIATQLAAALPLFAINVAVAGFVTSVEAIGKLVPDLGLSEKSKQNLATVGDVLNRLGQGVVTTLKLPYLVRPMYRQYIADTSSNLADAMKDETENIQYSRRLANFIGESGMKTSEVNGIAFEKEKPRDCTYSVVAKNDEDVLLVSAEENKLSVAVMNFAELNEKLGNHGISSSEIAEGITTHLPPKIKITSGQNGKEIELVGRARALDEYEEKLDRWVHGYASGKLTALKDGDQAALALVKYEHRDNRNRKAYIVERPGDGPSGDWIIRSHTDHGLLVERKENNNGLRTFMLLDTEQHLERLKEANVLSNGNTLPADKKVSLNLRGRVINLSFSKEGQLEKVENRSLMAKASSHSVGFN
jgi:hypothetical protein